MVVKREKPAAPDTAAIGKLLGGVAEECAKMDRHGGEMAGCHLRITRHLADLKPLAHRTWGKQLKTIGMYPGVASRYLTIAKSWLGEIGLAESDLAAQLPADLENLERVAGLTRVQLKGLLDRVDVRHAGRAVVSREVNGILGRQQTKKELSVGDQLVESAECFFQKAVAAARKWQKEGIDPQLREKVLGALDDGLAKIRDAVQTPTMAA
jgi:hypothetical protein